MLLTCFYGASSSFFLRPEALYLPTDILHFLLCPLALHATNWWQETRVVQNATGLGELQGVACDFLFLCVADTVPVRSYMFVAE